MQLATLKVGARTYANVVLLGAKPRDLYFKTQRRIQREAEISRSRTSANFTSSDPRREAEEQQAADDAGSRRPWAGRADRVKERVRSPKRGCAREPGDRSPTNLS